jgi:sialate O-acetylesterase
MARFLDPLEASAEARALKISAGSDATSAMELNDVLVGEVWLCSGQSNMDFTVAKTPKYSFAGTKNEAEEVAAANYPNIRMFSAEPIRSYEPKQTVPGTWQICTPENVREFSAIGYFFARDLQKELKVPIGILRLTYGASTAQAWIRREAIAVNPKLKPVLDEFDAQVKSYVPPTDEQHKQWKDEDEQARAEGKKPSAHPKDPVQDQHNPTVLFNGVVAPVIPFAFRGALWYQGESITPPRELFPLWNETLITDWRKLWNREFPFYFCQLAALQAASNSPEVREWQTEALKLPKTALAVTIDIGDRKNVHPKNKQEVGARLVRIALAKTYNRDIEYSGPQYESMTVEGNAIRLKFSHLGGGLVAKDGPLKTFEIAGADGKFVAADAKIDGDAIVVSNSEVPAPTAARYAWSNYPEGCNLYNQAGLPAAPFRTDGQK